MDFIFILLSLWYSLLTRSLSKFTDLKNLNFSFMIDGGLISGFRTHVRCFLCPFCRRCNICSREELNVVRCAALACVYLERPYMVDQF